MSEIVKLQGYLFLITILCGFAIGLFYDIIRIFRRIVIHPNWLINIEDTFFWIISSLFLFIILFNQNDGVLRGFVILGITIGIFLYFFIFSFLIITYVTKFTVQIINIIKLIIKLLALPVKVFFKLTLNPLLKLFKNLKKIIKINGKILKRKLKTIIILLRKI